MTDLADVSDMNCPALGGIVFTAAGGRHLNPDEQEPLKSFDLTQT